VIGVGERGAGGVLREIAVQVDVVRREYKWWIACDAEILRRVGVPAAGVGANPRKELYVIAVHQPQFSRPDETGVGDRHPMQRSLQLPRPEIEEFLQLREVRVLADLAHQVTQVTVTGWDYKQGQTISATSQATAFGQGSGMTGTDWLSTAQLGSRSEHLGQFSNLNQLEAQALVDAEYLQRTRRFVVAHGVAEGNPNLRVGSWLTLTGLGPRFSNSYYATATVHKFDTDKGYETDFTAECAYLGNAQ